MMAVATSFLQKYAAELFCVAMTVPTSWFLTVAFDLYGPKSWPDDKTRKWIFALCVIASTAIAVVLWRAIDPGDKEVVRVIVSVIAGVGSALFAPYAHTVAFAVIKRFAPGIDTAFK